MISFWVNCKGAFDRPFQFMNTIPKSIEANTGFFGPISKGLTLVAKGVKLSVSSISTLLFRSSPSNITWFVIAIWVNTIKRVMWRWGASYIFKEILERVKPTVTNIYALSTIIYKAVLTLFCTSSFHTTPGEVFLANMTDPAMSMRCMQLFGAFSRALSLQATTTGGITRFEMASSYYSSISAVTQTQPKLVSRFNVWRSICGGQHQ